jgi:methionyl-tRNA formyltransferase
MRVVFIGTVEFSLISLEKLIQIGVDIVGVCTKEKSNFNADFADLKRPCIENNIEYKLVDNINSDDSVEWIRSKNPDIILCFGWSSLIKENLLNLAPMGIIGYHPATLPQNRGRHPIIWALALGLDSTASTFFFMDNGADSGDILSQKSINISYSDNAQTLYKKLTSLALIQIEEFIPRLQSNNYKRVPQEHTKANIWRKRGKKDGLIDFRMSSKAIYNLVRALSKPYVGAHIEYKGDDIIIWRVEELEYKLDNIEPGQILESNKDNIIVKCYDGAIKIIEHEFTNLPYKGEYL